MTRNNSDMPAIPAPVPKKRGLKKGCKRNPKSGRKKGTPNKRSLMVLERLTKAGCDPIAELAKIARDPQTPLEVRTGILTNLLPYCYPRLATIEHRGDPAVIGSQVTVYLPAEQTPREIAAEVVAGD